MKEEETRSTDFSMSLLIQQLYGQDSYTEFKDHQDIELVKKYYLKLLCSYSKAIKDNIDITDKYQLKSLQKILDQGHTYLKKGKSFSEIDQIFVSLQTELIFQLLGQIPDRSLKPNVTNRTGNWKLNMFRQIQYIQNSKQKENLILEIIYTKFPTRFENWLAFKIDICSNLCQNDPERLLNYLKKNHPDIYDEVK
jgi:hypothetical protein